MTPQQIKQLHPGDEVYWNDPDEHRCSRFYRIHDIKIQGEVVHITDIDGSELECFMHELE